MQHNVVSDALSKALYDQVAPFFGHQQISESIYQDSILDLKRIPHWVKEERVFRSRQSWGSSEIPSPRQSPSLLDLSFPRPLCIENYANDAVHLEQCLRNHSLGNESRAGNFWTVVDWLWFRDTKKLKIDKNPSIYHAWALVQCPLGLFKTYPPDDPELIPKWPRNKSIFSRNHCR